MRTRTVGTWIGLVAALLALRPIGPSERLSRALLVPARLAASLGVPTRLAHTAGSNGADAETLERETALSLRLEHAVLRSAWPREVELRPSVVPVPGEVEGAIGDHRDRLRLRVEDTRDIAIGQPVIAGDVYVGSIDRIPYAERRPDRPGVFERVLRGLGLSAPPRRSPEDVVEVALITGALERVGALIERDQDGTACRLVAGGLAPLEDRIWLAVHNPETRATRTGLVRVHEGFGLFDRLDSLAEGFLIGTLEVERVGLDGSLLQGARESAGSGSLTREVRGILPFFDFGSGVNQVLVLTSPGEPRVRRTMQDIDPVPVLGDGGWREARWLAIGDTSPWRSTARLGAGRRAGVRVGAAVVDGVRLVGRVAGVDPYGATVSLLGDPGQQIALLAQAIDAPDAAPLALGLTESAGRAANGDLWLAWTPESSSAHRAWIAARGGGSIRVRVWTGSGMARVPRGLLVGECVLEADTQPESGVSQSSEPLEALERLAGSALRYLRVSSTGRTVGAPRVRIGGSRLARSSEEGPE